MSKKRYGIYSPRMLPLTGTSIWRTPSGEEVEVTQVSYDPNISKSLKADEKYIGEVTQFVRKERELEDSGI